SLFARGGGLAGASASGDPASPWIAREPSPGDAHPAPAGASTFPDPSKYPASDAPISPAPQDAGDWPLGRAIAQIGGICARAESAHALVVVDTHAAHERIVYERLKAGAAARDMPTQALLIPATFAATPAEIALAEGSAEALRALGLDISA